MVSNVTPAPRQIYLMGGRGARLVTVWNLPLSYVFIRVFLYGCAAAARHSYHNGVQTTVSSYRMVHHGVSVTYTLFGYPGSSAPPCGAPLTYSLSSPSFRGPKSSLSLSPLWFVPYRCSRDQDVLQNKRLYLHARPSEKPPSSGATLIDGESSPAFALVLPRNRIYSRRKGRYNNYKLINKFKWESLYKSRGRYKSRESTSQNFFLKLSLRVFRIDHAYCPFNKYHQIDHEESDQRCKKESSSREWTRGKKNKKRKKKVERRKECAIARVALRNNARRGAWCRI